MNVLNRMIQYSEEIINKKIPACQKHIWSCERFLRDLNNQKKSSFEYIFNEEKAWHFLKWMTMFKHRKGELAGTYIKPHIIQIFVYGNVYGWEHKNNKTRRFRKAYWQTSRKNAKSQGLSCVASYEISALGEPAAEVYCAATKKEQSRIVWDETKSMIENSKYKDKFKTNYGRITHIKSGSFFRALSKDDKLTGDGLNPQCGIIDEYHAHKTSEYYDILESGMGARKNPLMFIITTAGFELNFPCFRVEYNYISKILNPSIDIENDNYFAMINELELDDEGNLKDDLDDKRNWIKANPIVADPSNETGIAYLESRLKEAQQEPEKLRDVLTKNFNVWVRMAENQYINMDKWKICYDNRFPHLSKIDSIYMGIDLSSTIDLCSISWIFFKDNTFYVDSHSFIPESTFFERQHSDRVPYKLWKDKGYITVTPGAEVDYTFLQKWINEFEKKYNINANEILYDRWNATQFAQNMENEGYEMIEIRQGITTLSEPTKKFRALVYDKRIKHNNNPLLSWALSNAVVRKDANENIMLDKSKSTDRIDPAAALMNAFVRAIILNDESVYDNRSEGKKLFSLN